MLSPSPPQSLIVPIHAVTRGCPTVCPSVAWCPFMICSLYVVWSALHFNWLNPAKSRTRPAQITARFSGGCGGGGHISRDVLPGSSGAGSRGRDVPRRRRPICFIYSSFVVVVPVFCCLLLSLWDVDCTHVLSRKGIWALQEVNPRFPVFLDWQGILFDGVSINFENELYAKPTRNKCHENIWFVL